MKFFKSRMGYKLERISKKFLECKYSTLNSIPVSDQRISAEMIFFSANSYVIFAKIFNRLF
jgi:hypothetical protein